MKPRERERERGYDFHLNLNEYLEILIKLFTKLPCSLTFNKSTFTIHGKCLVCFPVTIATRQPGVTLELVDTLGIHIVHRHTV